LADAYRATVLDTGNVFQDGDIPGNKRGDTPDRRQVRGAFENSPLTENRNI
jgi:hypothetical protein